VVKLNCLPADDSQAGMKPTLVAGAKAIEGVVLLVKSLCLVY